MEKRISGMSVGFGIATFGGFLLYFWYALSTMYDPSPSFWSEVGVGLGGHWGTIVFLFFCFGLVLVGVTLAGWSIVGATRICDETKTEEETDGRG